MSASNLRNAWSALWRRLGAKGEADSVYEELLLAYSEPRRAYHTLAHVEHCLTELADVSAAATNLDAIEFAIWLHDAVYDTKAKDSEERSAALARNVLRSATLSDSFGDLVAGLILATKHATPPATLSEQILVDVDLSILGQSHGTFDEYERQIRSEYSWVPAEAFANGRSAILSSFLARPRIYSTEFFYGKYEKTARENLARSITQLLRT